MVTFAVRLISSRGMTVGLLALLLGHVVSCGGPSVARTVHCFEPEARNDAGTEADAFAETMTCFELTLHSSLSQSQLDDLVNTHVHTLGREVAAWYREGDHRKRSGLKRTVFRLLKSKGRLQKVDLSPLPAVLPGLALTQEEIELLESFVCY